MSDNSNLDNGRQRNNSDSDLDSFSSNILRVSNRPRPPQRPSLSSEELSRRRILHNDDILALLPGSQVYSGNAEAVSKCRECDGQATRQTCGYCVDHFCEEYRLGNVDIPEAVPDTLQQATGKLYEESSPDEIVPMKSVQRTKSSESNSPELSPRQERRDLSRRTQRHGDVQQKRERHAQAPRKRDGNGFSSSSSDDKSSKKPKICSAPMCTKPVEIESLCRKCHDNLTRHKLGKKQAGRNKCAFRQCKRLTTTKGGLCNYCNGILQQENAREIEMPMPENDYMPETHIKRGNHASGVRRNQIPLTSHRGVSHREVNIDPITRYEHQGARPRTQPSVARRTSSQRQSHVHMNADDRHHRMAPRREPNQRHTWYDTTSETHKPFQKPAAPDFEAQPSSIFSSASSSQLCDENHTSHRHARVRMNADDQHHRIRPSREPNQRATWYNTSEADMPYREPAASDFEAPPSSIFSSASSSQYYDDQGWKDTSPNRNQCKKRGCEFFGDKEYYGYCSVCYRDRMQ